MSKSKIFLARLYCLVFERYNYLRYFTLRNIRNHRRLSKLDVKSCKVNQHLFVTGMGSIEIAEKCVFGYKLGGFHFGGSIEFQARYKESLINIGNNIKTNNNIFICAANKITIGRDTLIGQNVTIMDFEAHGVEINCRNKIGEIGEVVIGENVWIGNNTTILKNTKIGSNSIIAAGAVVSGTFPSNVIIGGVPAKVIKTISG